MDTRRPLRVLRIRTVRTLPRTQNDEKPSHPRIFHIHLYSFTDIARWPTIFRDKSPQLDFVYKLRVCISTPFYITLAMLPSAAGHSKNRRKRTVTARRNLEPSERELREAFRVRRNDLKCFTSELRKRFKITV